MSCWTKARNAVERVADNPLVVAAEDVAASLIPGGAPFIPAINAADAAIAGKGVKGALTAGGEAFAGQEIIGAAANAFPETAGSIGLDTSGNTLSDTIGTSSGAGSWAGPGTIGGAVGSEFDSVSKALGFGGGISGATGNTATGTFDLNGQMVPANTNAAGATTNAATGQTIAPPSAPTSIAPSSGAVTSASSLFDPSQNPVNIDLSSTVPGAATSAPTGMASVLAPDSTFGAGGTNIAPSADSFPGPVGGNVPLTGATDTANITPPASTATGASTDSIGSTPSNIFTQAAGSAPQLSGSFPSADFGGDATGKSGGGLSDWLPSKGDVGKLALNAALPLGGLAYEATKGSGKLPPESAALQPSGQVTAPLIAAENAGANAYSSGTLTAPQRASIDQWIQGQQNMLLQQLASEGSTDPTHDTRYIQGIEDIQQKAVAQAQEMLQQDLDNAFKAAGLAGQNLSAVAREQLSQDTSFNDALSQALAALGGSVGGLTRKAA